MSDLPECKNCDKLRADISQLKRMVESQEKSIDSWYKKAKEMEAVLIRVAGEICYFDSVQMHAQDLIREKVCPGMSRKEFSDWLDRLRCDKHAMAKCEECEPDEVRH